MHITGEEIIKRQICFLRRVLEIEPNHIEALNGKGTSLYRLADYDKAKKCFEKVLKMDPKNIVAFNSIEISNKKKEDDSSQQKIEKPAPSQASSQQKEKPAPPPTPPTPPPSADTSQQKIEKPTPPPSVILASIIDKKSLHHHHQPILASRR